MKLFVAQSVTGVSVFFYSYLLLNLQLLIENFIIKYIFFLNFTFTVIICMYCRIALFKNCICLFDADCFDIDYIISILFYITIIILS